LHVSFVLAVILSVKLTITCNDYKDYLFLFKLYLKIALYFSYNGPLLDSAIFAKAIDGGAKSSEYTKFIHEISEELKTLCSLEESVHATQGPDDASAFILELSSFLKELGCPYLSLTMGMF